jgi:hypothetical protein
MTKRTLLLERPDILPQAQDASDVWLDWSEAASPAVHRAPRVQLPAYVFHGETASHLDGQGCDVVSPDDARTGLYTVVFSCGCVDRVLMSSLDLR